MICFQSVKSQIFRYFLQIFDSCCQYLDSNVLPPARWCVLTQPCYILLFVLDIAFTRNKIALNLLRFDAICQAMQQAEQSTGEPWETFPCEILKNLAKRCFSDITQRDSKTRLKSCCKKKDAKKIPQRDLKFLRCRNSLKSIVRVNCSVFLQVWWSPCTSRECPDDDSTVDLILDDCFDHCKLWNSSPVVPLTEYHNGMAVRPVAEVSSSLLTGIFISRELIYDWSTGYKTRLDQNKYAEGELNSVRWKYFLTLRLRQNSMRSRGTKKKSYGRSMPSARRHTSAIHLTYVWQKYGRRMPPYVLLD